MLRTGSVEDYNEDSEKQAIWELSLVDWMVFMAMVERMVVVVLGKEK